MSKRENFTCAICGEVRPKPFMWPARDTNKNIVQACVDCYQAQGMPTTLDAAITMIYQMRDANAAKNEGK
jgi:hypothetical protein